MPEKRMQTVKENLTNRQGIPFISFPFQNLAKNDRCSRSALHNSVEDEDIRTINLG